MTHIRTMSKINRKGGGSKSRSPGNHHGSVVVLLFHGNVRLSSFLGKVQWYIHPCFHSNRCFTTNQWALKTYRASSNEETVFQFKIFHDSCLTTSSHVTYQSWINRSESNCFVFSKCADSRKRINGFVQGN